jgi:hypothetical protein
VGIVFRRKECDRGLVPVHASESDDAVGYLYHPLSDTTKDGNCKVSRLTNLPNQASCLRGSVASFFLQPARTLQTPTLARVERPKAVPPRLESRF